MAITTSLIALNASKSFITFELKNQWTNQNVEHAKKQYRNDRDPKESLFQLGRCLVHFAVDTEEVFMTTFLKGKDMLSNLFP